MDYRVREVGGSSSHDEDGGRKRDIRQDESKGPLLRIGRSQRGSLKDVFVRLRDLCLHLIVLGESGFGKTTLIISLLTQVWNVMPLLPWLVFDLKGEYLRHLPHINGIVVLKPGLKKVEVHTDPELVDDFGESYSVTFMPLRVDLLDVSSTGLGEKAGDGVVNRVFTLLKESLASTFKESSELSPLMEKILLKSLQNAYNAYHGGKGFLDLILREVEGYADSEGRSRGRSDIVRSSEALANRIERFRRGYLEDILNGGEGTLTPTLISRRKVIIDLSECVAQGSTEDLRLLLNILIEKVFEEASRRGLTEGHDLRHITVVEEANLLVPEVFHRKTSGDITPVEEMFLIARGYGEGFILVAQRPTISGFTLSNAGTRIIFRTPCDTKKIGDILGINEIGENTIKNLQKFEAFTSTIEEGPRIVVTPKPRFLRRVNLAPVGMSHLRETPRAQLTQPSSEPQRSVSSAPNLAAFMKAYCIPDLDNGKGESGGQSGDCLSTECEQSRVDSSGLKVGEEDLSRLLKKGLSSDKFRLFRAIAVSPQLSITVSDAIRSVFQGKRWKYLDAVRSLTDRTYWKIPPLCLENGGERLRLSAYGVAAWKLVQPVLAAVRRKE